MSDFTNDMRGVFSRTRGAGDRREGIAYFAVIFVVALPVACVSWALTAARHLHLPDKSPVTAAWSDASIITSMILSV